MYSKWLRSFVYWYTYTYAYALSLSLARYSLFAFNNLCKQIKKSLFLLFEERVAKLLKYYLIQQNTRDHWEY